MANDIEITVSVRNAGDGFNRINQQMRNLRSHAAASARSLDSFSAGTQALSGAAAGAGAALGGGGGAAGLGMAASLKAVAAVIGGAALPALGALVPMLTGAGTAAGVALVASKAVGEAWSASSKKGKDFSKAVKGMKEPQRELTGALKDVRKEFKGYGDDLLGSILPGVTAGIKGLGPAFGLVKAQGLLMGKTLGDLARDAGRALGSEGMQGLLSKNATMGREFVDRMGRSFGTLAVSVLEFGAASRPTFNALTAGFSGLMSKGLPGFFEGLTGGISGAASMFRGLFDGVNLLLPAFGRLSGQLADTLGPMLGSLFRNLGRITAGIMDGLRPALQELKPIFDAAAAQMDVMGEPLATLARGFGRLLGGAVKIGMIGFNALVQVLKIAAPFVRDLGSAIGDILAPAFGSLSGSMGWTKRLSGFISAHRLELQGMFAAGADAVMGFVQAVVSNMPTAFGMFRFLASTVLTAFGVIVNGAAAAFGWMPGIGGKIRNAAKGFNEFAAGAKRGMDKAQGFLNEFSRKASRRVRIGRLEMNVKGFRRQLATVKKELRDPDLTKERRARLTAEKKRLEAKIRAAEKELRGFRKTHSAKLSAKDATARGRRSAQKSILSLNGVTRGLYAKNNTARGKRSAQRTILSLAGVTRGLYARNATGAGVGAAKRAIASVRGKTVTIRTNYVTNYKVTGKATFGRGGRLHPRAHGGVIGSHAAEGGPRSGLTLVGEQGPELVNLPTGSRVRTNGDSERIAAGMGGGGGREPVVIELRSGGSRLDDLLLEILRKSIRVRGGNVQLVLGRA